MEKGELSGDKRVVKLNNADCNNNATIKRAKGPEIPCEVGKLTVGKMMGDKLNLSKNESPVKMKSKPSTCGRSPKAVKKSMIKSVVIPVKNNKKADIPVKRVFDKTDKIVVSVRASKDEFISNDEMEMEQIFPVEEIAPDVPNVHRPEMVSTKAQPLRQAILDMAQSQPGPSSGGSANNPVPIDVKQMRSDPVFKEMVAQVVAEQMKMSKESDKTSAEVVNASMSQNMRNENLDKQCIEMGTDMQVVGELVTPARPSKIDKDKQNQLVQNTIKSPSDTTVYAPAIVQNLNGVDNSIVNNDTINRISDFVARMRLESSENQPLPQQMERASIVVPPIGTVRTENQVSQPAKDVADQMIVDAERFRVEVERPSGMVHVNNNRPINELMNQPMIEGSIEQPSNAIAVSGVGKGGLHLNPTSYPQGTVDDQFFHITCHVDKS